MVTAIVLIKTEHGRINQVATDLAALPGIAEVYSVGGSHDIVAIMRVPTNQDIADLVTERMVHVEGIRSTETLVAFKAFSREDIESVFTAGMDE